MSVSTPTEEGCLAVTAERKYYRRGSVFIKRSLRPSEFMTGHRGLHVPRANNERLRNEAHSMRFVAENTQVPVPRLICDFEDAAAYYLVMEYVEGVGMSELEESQKAVVEKELEEHLATLHSLRSNKLGGPGGTVIPPYRVTRRTNNDTWSLRSSPNDEYVFCHNDLSQHNVVVDPKTLKITGILDWEYAGFFPQFFDAPFYKRVALPVHLGVRKTTLWNCLISWRSRNWCRMTKASLTKPLSSYSNLAVRLPYTFDNNEHILLQLRV